MQNLSHSLSFLLLRPLYQEWEYMPIIPAKGRRRQKDFKSEASLGCNTRSYLKNQHLKKRERKEKKKLQKPPQPQHFSHYRGM